MNRINNQSNTDRANTDRANTDESNTDGSDTLDDLLRLSMIEGVGPIMRKKLLARFGSVADILSAPLAELRQIQGIGPKTAQAIASARSEIDVSAELAACSKAGYNLIGERDERYPKLLREIPDPPGLLFVHGELRQEDSLAIAIVGTRHATQYGLRQAERLATGLTRAGITIVSGLARGIDTAAHQAALAANGRTVAVLGSGLLNLYPPENAGLAAEIATHGAVISESPCNTPPLSGLFPQRNRVITGLSLGVIVVEAPLRSGALVSAQHAMEQGREVFAVPGRVDNRTSRGCHRLIRDGAKLVESVEDVLEELGPLANATPSRDGRLLRNPAELQLNVQEQAVLTVIQDSPTSIDEVVQRSGLPVNRVLATISVLEMRKLVRRISGNFVARA